jgi:hypothetical protein
MRTTKDLSVREGGWDYYRGCYLKTYITNYYNNVFGALVQTYLMLSTIFPHGASFWISCWSKGQKVERHGIYRIETTNFNGMVSWGLSSGCVMRWACPGGGGGGGVGGNIGANDGRHGKVITLIPIPKMGRWKTVVATSRAGATLRAEGLADPF